MHIYLYSFARFSKYETWIFMICKWTV